MIWCGKDRNAEALRARSSCPRICSASPRFKISAEHGYGLTPGRYVRAEEVENDGVPLAEKMEGLTRELATQFHESEKLQSAIRDNLPPFPQLMTTHGFNELTARVLA